MRFLAQIALFALGLIFLMAGLFLTANNYLTILGLICMATPLLWGKSKSEISGELHNYISEQQEGYRAAKDEEKRLTLIRKEEEAREKGRIDARGRDEEDEYYPNGVKRPKNKRFGVLGWPR
jgi:hypothetical protein